MLERSKRSPLYIEIGVTKDKIVRGLFYGRSDELRLSIEVDGLEVLDVGPQPQDELFATFERYVGEMKSGKGPTDLSDLRNRGAVFFVAKESGRWSILAGLPNGKFVDTNFRFDTKAEAEGVLA